MTLLEVIQYMSVRTGLRTPSAATTSADPGVLQLIALLNELMTEITSRWLFEELIQEATWTATAVEDQGDIDALAPRGFGGILPHTFYNRTTGLEVLGPISKEAWQADKALSSVGTTLAYRIRNNHLLFNPVPTAGHALAFEYRSLTPIYNATDAVYKEFFTKDADEFLLNPNLLLLGLRYKWKAEKGFSYAEDLSRFEIFANDLAGRSGSKPVLDAGSCTRTKDAKPGLVIPPGNWPL